jgi:hypothetical protein
MEIRTSADAGVGHREDDGIGTEANPSRAPRRRRQPERSVALQSPRIPTRQTLRRAALVVALLVGSSTAVAGMSSAPSSLANSGTGSASAHTVARVLPGDRAIMLLEGRDPANAVLTFIVAPVTAIDALTTRIDSETRLNICVPCDNLA